MTKIFTIGGYGHTKESFKKTLLSNSINLFVDVRQRRGMRGSLYSFLNAKALEANLQDYGISYIHIKSLAPTSEVRDVQREADASENTSKRKRDSLSQDFINNYKSIILSKASKDDIIKSISGYDNICLFCVEKAPEACHRSILSDWLEADFGKAVHI